MPEAELPADRFVLREIGGPPDSVPDPLLVAVTWAARGGVLWWVISACMALCPGGARRTAVRGAVAVACALGGAHLLKGVLPVRRRPPTEDHLARRMLPETPTSSSMPSAHAASGMAFTVVVMSERPAWGLLTLPLALVAAYGRIRTKVHWPSDVLVGGAVGLAVGAAVLVFDGNGQRCAHSASRGSMVR